MSRFEMLPVASITIDPAQVRSKRDPDAQRQLEESVKLRGVLQSIGVTEERKLIWGAGRLLAAQAAGVTEIPAVVMDKPVSEGEFLTMQMIENMARSDLSPADQWRGCVRLMEANPQWQLKDVARALSLDPSTVTKLLSPSKCIKGWQDLLINGLCGITDCYAASKMDEKGQAELLALKM